MSRLPTWLTGLIPLLLLALLTGFFFTYGPLGIFRAAWPPVEELTITRVTFPEATTIVVRLVNGGPEPVTVAQVAVDEAYWTYDIRPGHRIPRFGTATVTIPYRWVAGAQHQITVITRTGLTFTHTVAVATQTPGVDGRYLATFALLGVYAGVIPVFLGLCWFPFLAQLRPQWLDFVLALTIGLLVFLGVDALAAAGEAASQVPQAYQGHALVVLGGVGTFLLLTALGRTLRGSSGPESARGRLLLAYFLATGIGLHNLGEGLAIGTAYTVGEIALGTFLVVGFALHNTTEGLGIIAPIATQWPGLAPLVVMGAMAGLPTVVGTWLGAYAYSPLATTLCLAVGTGAIAQVVWEIGRLLNHPGHTGLTSAWSALGMLTGLGIMYFTGLLVAV